MADQIVNYQCPCCTAALRFDGGEGKLVCDFCRGKYDVAEIEKMYKESEERAAKAKQENDSSKWDTNDFSSDWGMDNSMKSYSCPSCGAELICSETTAATCCPYCGNQSVIPGQFTGALRPEYIIPFKKDKNAAMEALRSHYKGKILLPKAFIDENHIDDIQGVYVPFWLYDCVAEGIKTYHCEKDEKRETATERIVTTHHFNVLREGNMAFKKVPADASKRMPDTQMDSIEPFDYSEIKPFSTAYMPGFLADKYDEDSETCGKRMEERCKDFFDKSIDETVKNYDRKSEKEKNIVIKKGPVHYAMFPVWLLSTNWNGQNFLFSMNGQTGKMTGDLPMDKGKYWGFFGIISAVLIGLMMLLNFVILSKPMPTVAMVIFCILVPILLGFGVVSGMKAKLRSVRTPNAAEYSDGGLKLTANMDHFTGTTVKRTPKPKNN